MGRGESPPLFQTPSPVGSIPSSSGIGEQEGGTKEAEAILNVWRYVGGEEIFLDLFYFLFVYSFKVGRSHSPAPSFYNEKTKAHVDGMTPERWLT